VSQAAYLGAANLMGYVVGALIILDLARAIPLRPLLLGIIRFDLRPATVDA
jgi:hypothetical protein